MKKVDFFLKFTQFSKSFITFVPWIYVKYNQ